MKKKRLRAIKHSKAIVLFIFAIALLMGFSGCAAPLLVKYDSYVGESDAIPARAHISVVFSEEHLAKGLQKQKSKQSIIETVSRDLNQNLFSNRGEMLDVVVNIDRLAGKKETLIGQYIADAGFALWGLGLLTESPLDQVAGSAALTVSVFLPRYEHIIASNVSLQMQKGDEVLGNYRSTGIVSQKQFWISSLDFPSLFSQSLQKAIEDIKQQIIRDKNRIAQAIKEKPIITETQPVAEVRKTEPTPTKEALAYADVDRRIPISRNQNPDAIAVVLGIEKYRNIPDVSYARRDATIFRQYAARVLGIQDDVYHLYYRVDEEATKAEFEKLFAENGWIARRAQPTTDVYIYYAGHGAPEVRDRSAHLIPHDGDINYPVQTGFSLNRLYAELGKLDVRSVTVFLDACFSGISREDEVLLADARPVYIELQGPTARGNITVFTAATGNQVSSAWPEQGHGLFTYYLLKGLRGEADQNWDEQITLGELNNYLKENVSRRAGLLDREQTPLMITRDESRVLVQYR